MKEAGLEYSGIRGAPKPLEPTKPDPEGGSTDVADVSWIVPEITLGVTTAPNMAPWHSWVVGSIRWNVDWPQRNAYAAKGLGLTMVDLFENRKMRQDIRKEFETRKGNEVWKAIIPEGPPTRY